VPSVDFRRRAFNIANVRASGRDVGREVYWKVYAVENLIRVVIHSVLSVQVNPNWWKQSVDATLQGKIAGRMTSYANQPWHSTPGKHEIYYTFLSDLNAIITAHSHLFIKLIPDIHQWIARIEQMRLPRNIVGHMNWPHAADRQRIDVFYADVQALVSKLATVPGFALLIP
jgi:hypothetical protein